MTKELIGTRKDELFVLTTLKARDASPSNGWDDDPLDMEERPREPLRLMWSPLQRKMTPNLQNIPIRTPEGQRIRDLFRST